MTNLIEKTINRVRLESLILAQSGKIFTVLFIKRDGSPRIMNARKGVSRGVSGTGSPNGLHTAAMKVFDMKADAFRQINLDTVKWVKAGGVRYTVVG